MLWIYDISIYPESAESAESPDNSEYVPGALKHHPLIKNGIWNIVPPSFCTYILVQLALPYTLSWVIFRLHEFELEPGGRIQPCSIHAPRESNNPFRINPHSDQ